MTSLHMFKHRRAFASVLWQNIPFKPNMTVLSHYAFSSVVPTVPESVEQKIKGGT